MGNQLIKDYTISQDVQTTGGMNQIWKVHNAQKIHKKDHQSVFIVDKRHLDKAGIKGQQKEEILKLLRKEPQMLLQLKHPNVLQLLEPMNEDIKRVVFITEKVQYSLASLFESGEIKHHISSELSIKIHLLEIIEALSFIHNDANIVHLSLSPENIYVSADGKWNLSGFNFSTQIIGDQPNQIAIDFSPKPYDKTYIFYPNLTYLAPELAETSQKCHYKSDLYSFGVLLTTLLKIKYSPGTKDYTLWNFDGYYNYKNNIQASINQLKNQKFFLSLNQKLQQMILSLLSVNMEIRPTLNQIHQSDFFQDPLVQTVNHLQRFDQLDNTLQNVILDNFSKQFQQNIKFENIVVKQQILPKIIPLIKIEALMSSIINICVEITKLPDYLTKVEYQNLIWSHMRQISKSKTMPAKSLYLIVQNLPNFFTYISNEDFQNELIPLYLKCLEFNHFKLQEVALNATEQITQKLDYIQTKNRIFPRILQLCLDNNMQARLLAIETLKKIRKILDRNTICDQLIPVMDKIRKTNGLTKEVADSLLVMYRDFSTQLTDEIIVNKIIPGLLPFLLEPIIGKQLLSQYAQLITDLVETVQKNRMKFQIDLQEIHNKQEQQLKKSSLQNDELDFINQFTSIQPPEQNQNSTSKIEFPQQQQILQNQGQLNEISARIGQNSTPQVTTNYLSIKEPVQQQGISTNNLGQKVDLFLFEPQNLQISQIKFEKNQFSEKVDPFKNSPSLNPQSISEGQKNVFDFSQNNEIYRQGSQQKPIIQTDNFQSFPEGFTQNNYLSFQINQTQSDQKQKPPSPLKQTSQFKEQTQKPVINTQTKAMSQINLSVSQKSSIYDAFQDIGDAFNLTTEQFENRPMQKTSDSLTMQVNMTNTQLLQQPLVKFDFDPFGNDGSSTQQNIGWDTPFKPPEKNTNSWGF